MQSLDSTDKSDYSLWKATRRIKRPYSQIQPIRKEDRTCAKTDEEMAATFGRHLQRTFQPNDIESSLPPSEPDLNVEYKKLDLLKPKEVAEGICNLNNKM
ncbi:glucuronosyltransferase [Sarracenia purpurea var. burkii]